MDSTAKSGNVVLMRPAPTTSESQEQTLDDELQTLTQLGKPYIAGLARRVLAELRRLRAMLGDDDGK